jgi:hypothetical protein
MVEAKKNHVLTLEQVNEFIESYDSVISISDFLSLKDNHQYNKYLLKKLMDYYIFKVKQRLQ